MGPAYSYPLSPATDSRAADHCSTKRLASFRATFVEVLVVPASPILVPDIPRQSAWSDHTTSQKQQLAGTYRVTSGMSHDKVPLGTAAISHTGQIFDRVLVLNSCSDRAGAPSGSG